MRRFRLERSLERDSTATVSLLFTVLDSYWHFFGVTELFLLTNADYFLESYFILLKTATDFACNS